MRIDLRSLKPITVPAAEIAERYSFVDPRNVRNPRTDRKHGCVSANVSRFRVKVGGKLRTVCVQARPELHVFLLESGKIMVATTSKIAGTRFWNAKENPCLV